MGDLICYTKKITILHLYTLSIYICVCVCVCITKVINGTDKNTK